ncbi:MAG: YraN family protein [Blastocatellia bacterium]|nr:YraN family protein [Blastocatellia bacterium]
MRSFRDILQQLRKTEHGTDELTTVSTPHLETGMRGEQLAAQFLELSGYRIVVRNFIAPVGYSRKGRPLTGEIDIIAYDESAMPFTLAFIEVKTRTSSEIAAPESAVDRRKRKRIERAARVYRRLLAIDNEPYRYDVVSVVTAPNEAPKLTLLRGYFSDSLVDR